MNRYRLVFEDVSSQVPVYFSYEGQRYGYRSKDQLVNIKGWIVSKKDESIDLIVRYSDGLKEYDVEVNKLLKSSDVHKLHPTINGAENARFLVPIRVDDLMQYFDASEYFAIDLLVVINGNKQHPRKVASLALIKDDEDKGEPIFILGSPRSGTTVVGNAIRRIYGGKGYGECHVSFLIHNINLAIKEYFTASHVTDDPGTLVNTINAAVVKGVMGNNFKKIYQLTHSNQYYIDKTPGRNMLYAIKDILEIWPEAKFIFCKRRGIENVDSRMRKFPHVEFAEHCIQWKETMDIWCDLKKQIPDLSYIEVDQYEVQTNPAKIAKKIGAYLGFNAKDIDKTTHFFIHQNPQLTRKHASAKSLKNMEWNDEMKSMFENNYGQMLLELGYSLDENYFLEKKD